MPGSEEKPKVLLEDKRTIKAISSRRGERWYAGEGFSEIKVYGEPGPYCMLPWFAVYDLEGEILCRVNAAHVVEVVYVSE